jgi:hypothetical protein
MKKLVRILLLIMVGIAIGLLWMYCSAFLTYDLARGDGSLMLADRAAGVLTVFIMAAAPAIPVQSLFPRHSILAAAAVGWIPLALALASVAPAIDGIPSAHHIEFAVIEGCVDWMGIVLGAWTVSRIRKSSVAEHSTVHTGNSSTIGEGPFSNVRS